MILTELHPSRFSAGSRGTTTTWCVARPSFLRVVMHALINLCATQTDIEGTKVGWKPRHQRREGAARDIMQVADINAVGFQSNRVT